MKSKHDYLEATRAVHAATKGGKFSTARIRKAKKELASVVKFFSISETGAMVLSSINQSSFVEGEVGIKSMVTHNNADEKQLTAAVDHWFSIWACGGRDNTLGG